MGILHVLWNRFSSSGLAAAWKELLAERGFVGHVVYRPRYDRDPVPFVVETQIAVDAADFATSHLRIDDEPGKAGPG